jgi:hypothetical protein
MEEGHCTPSRALRVGFWSSTRLVKGAARPWVCLHRLARLQVCFASEASAPLERLTDAYRRTVVDVKSYVTQLELYQSTCLQLRLFTHSTSRKAMGWEVSWLKETR